MRLLKSAKEKTFRAVPRRSLCTTPTFPVSYPRSGNTWMRFLLANLLAPHETITFRNIENFVPDLHKSAAVLDNGRGAVTSSRIIGVTIVTRDSFISIVMDATPWCPIIIM